MDIEARVVKPMLNITKKALAEVLVRLESSCSLDVKQYESATWYGNKIPGIAPHAEERDNIALDETDRPDWQSLDKVEYCGVSVVSRAKVVMFESLGGYHRPEARKAMVFTEYYRPLKYPNSRNLVYTINFMRHHFIKSPRKNKKAEIPGSVALLGSRVYDTDNYYHFWVDVIADIWYIRHNLPDAELPEYYLVPFANLKWQWEILKICGLDEGQVIPYTKYNIVSPKKLVLPIRDKGVANLPPWLSLALYDISGWTPRQEEGERWIFISRADASRRRVANEAAVRERLVSEGFEVHTLDGLSIKEQQSLFASAAIICAPHGAALTNLVWCRPGTVIIDLLSENHLPPCFKELSEQNGVIYYPYICQQVAGEEAGIRGDILISDQQINSVLKVVARHAVPRAPVGHPS